MATMLKAPGSWPRLLTERWATPPEDLAAAEQAGAFAALRRVVSELGPAGTIGELQAAGLTGRGGAGFPTAVKWRDCAAAGVVGEAVVVANGYGADPGSSTDRALLEHDPWAVIEGTLIAAFAVGASEAIVVVPADAPAAAAAVRDAVEGAIEAGYAGENVLGSGRAIDLAVRAMAGSFMLGEETVLLRALEGRRAQPEQRPPHPTRTGLRGRPTVVDNVATLALAAWIVRNGADAFRAIGDTSEPGTALVHVRGADEDGLAEVPTGTRLSDLAALVDGGRALKAYLVGGPTGALLPASAGDTAYGSASLRAAGGHVGSGSVVIVDERACIVDLVRTLLRFSADAACGKTIPCRIGLRRLSEIVDRAAAGTARRDDDRLADDLAADVIGSGLCDHERLAARTLSSARQHFDAEFRAHVDDGRCPAGVCRLVTAAVGSA